MSWLAFATESELHLADAETFEPKIVLKGVEAEVSSICFNNTCDLVAAAQSRYHYSFGPTMVWEVNSGREILILEKSLRICIVQFSADGNELLCRCYGGNIMLWNIVDKSLLHTITIPVIGAMLPQICYIRHDQFICLAFPEWRSLLKVVDTRTGLELRCLLPPERKDDIVTCIAFNSATNLIATGGKHGNIVFWNAVEWTISSELHIAENVTGDLVRIVRHLIYFDGGYKLAVAVSAVVCIFDGTTNEQLLWFSAGSYLRSISVNPSGTQIACTYEQMKITKVFDLALGGVEIASWESNWNSQVCFSVSSVLLM